MQITVGWQCNVDGDDWEYEPTLEYFTSQVATKGITCTNVEPGGAESDTYWVTLEGTRETLLSWYTSDFWCGDEKDFEADITSV